MVFPSVSFHPSSHFVLLACRLRDSRYRFPALNANTGLTPCAVIYPPFRVSLNHIAKTLGNGFLHDTL